MNRRSSALARLIPGRLGASALLAAAVALLAPLPAEEVELQFRCVAARDRIPALHFDNQANTRQVAAPFSHPSAAVDYRGPRELVFHSHAEGPDRRELARIELAADAKKLLLVLVPEAREIPEAPITFRIVAFEQPVPAAPDGSYRYLNLSSRTLEGYYDNPRNQFRVETDGASPILEPPADSTLLIWALLDAEAEREKPIFMSAFKHRPDEAFLALILDSRRQVGGLEIKRLLDPMP